jgi:hypothetical protein
MSISTYLRPYIHQNGPEIFGVKLGVGVYNLYRDHLVNSKPQKCSYLHAG